MGVYFVLSIVFGVGVKVENRIGYFFFFMEFFVGKVENKYIVFIL